MNPRPEPIQPPDSAPSQTSPLSIVALDDDADFREFITSVLENDGHHARAVGTPDELYLAIAHSMPDIVLLDMKMGRHSGEEVLAALRERWAKLCVVVVTGYPSMETMRQTFKRDVFDYLAKPFSIEELRATIRQAIAAFDLGLRPQDRLRAELGRQIRVARTERGWTLKDLSEASGVSVSQLSSIERGAHLPSLESMLAVSRAMEVPASAWLRAAGF